MDHAVNWVAISAICQVVGAIAVVTSLIYVASEVRRNTRASHLAAIRSTHDALNHWIQLVAEHPPLAEALISYASVVSCTGGSETLRRYITFKLRPIWKKTCGVGGKQSCETSIHIPEFRLGGVYARIGLARSLRSTSISYSRQLGLQGCMVNRDPSPHAVGSSVRVR